MAIAKGFRCFGRIRLDKTAIRVRQIHAKIMKAPLLATDVPVRFAEICLRMTRTMAQWHEHLPRPQHRRRHILTHDRVAAGEPLLVPQPLENPRRRVPLFLVNVAVAFKNGVNPRHIRSKLLRYGPLAPPIPRRNGKTQHLRDRISVNAKPIRRLPAAQPLNHHRMSDLGIKFHCEHPSSPSMPLKTSRRPSRTGTLLRRCHTAAHSRFSGTLCIRDLYLECQKSYAKAHSALKHAVEPLPWE